MVDQPRPEHDEYPLISEQLSCSDLARIEVSAIRLVGTLMLETNDEWAFVRCHMSLETLARVTDNSSFRLPDVAALSDSDLSEGRCPYTSPSGSILSDLVARKKELIDAVLENHP